MIEIQGLNRRQRAICDVLWNMDTQAEVDAFIQSLLIEEQRLEAISVQQMMIAACYDQIDDTDMAKIVLRQFML